jgi:uncharacterized protein YdeI (YjbR/CyaY-like superfamily)
MRYKGSVEPTTKPVAFADQRGWERWLERHHETADHVWLRIAKKASGVRSVSLAQVQESALCFGWIDGQSWPVDDRFYLVRFTPRRPRSRWSARNRDLVAELVRAGRMRPAGLDEIARAKRDGRWDDGGAGSPPRPRPRPRGS